MKVRMVRHVWKKDIHGGKTLYKEVRRNGQWYEVQEVKFNGKA